MIFCEKYAILLTEVFWIKEGKKMQEIKDCLARIFAEAPHKLVVSKPANKQEPYKKITVEKKSAYYQVAKYTEKQVFHENIAFEEIGARCEEMVCGHYQEGNAWSAGKEFHLMISKKGNPMLKVHQTAKETPVPAEVSHNRRKNYLLEEGQSIPPLVDMGIFTKEGKIVRSMYDKYKQINRFLEIIDDAVKNEPVKRLNIIDFGCGKSYLTFIVYYYLTVIRGLEVQMIGLDLKEDVIRKCNRAAQEYGYANLRVELGDITGYACPFPVDMVITLHACDTATDFALYNAIQWNARMIFSVPCCQHELNGQIQSEEYSLLTRYGIVQERFSALLTDSIRCNLLEYSGYKAQLMEFVDFENTPKNLLIRAVRRGGRISPAKQGMREEVERVMKEFHLRPTLYRLLVEESEE